jgi:hypothetical protein
VPRRPLAWRYESALVDRRRRCGHERPRDRGARAPAAERGTAQASRRAAGRLLRRSRVRRAVVVGFAAGSFLYIAASDLIPEVKHDHLLRNNVIHFAASVVGLAIILLVRATLGR